MVDSETIVVKRTVGENVHKILAQATVQGIVPSMIGLIVNSYDADATKVEVVYDPDRSLFIVRDDGIGMRQGNGLEGFFRTCGSDKIDHRITSRGRVAIGNKGTEVKSAIMALAGQYDLETICDGDRTVIHEEFGKGEFAEELQGKVYSTTKDKHGTTLTLRGLNFGNERPFSLDELKRKLRMDVPILPDFKVYVNGDEIKPRSVENATKFKMRRKGNYMGDVEIELYISPRAHPTAGLHVYVNGRAVGDAKARLNEFLKRNKLLAGKITGFVNANGLEKDVLLNWMDFNKDGKSVVEFEKFLEEAVKSICNYQTNNPTKSKASEWALKTSAIKTVGEELRKVLGEGLEVKFGDFEEVLPGKYEPHEKVICINPNSPALIKAKERNGAYARGVLEAAVETYALSMGGNDLGRFMDEKTKLWKKLTPAARISKEEKKVVHPFKVYNLLELSELHEFSRATIRRMINSGVLLGNEEEIIGENYLECKKNLEFFVDLGEVISEKLGSEEQNNFYFRYEKALKVFDEVYDSINPVVQRFGKGEERAYFVYKPCADLVYEKLMSIDLRKTDEPLAPLKELSSLGYSLPQLVKMTGLDKVKVSQIISRELIDIKREQAGPIQFNLRQFVRNSLMKKNDN